MQTGSVGYNLHCAVEDSQLITLGKRTYVTQSLSM